MTVDHDAIMSRLSDLRTTAEAAAELETDPYSRQRGFRVRWAWSLRTKHNSGAEARHLAEGAPSPAEWLRWIDWAEQVAAEHEPWAMTNDAGQTIGRYCGSCQVRDHPAEAPCDTFTGLATALGLSTPTSSEEPT